MSEADTTALIERLRRANRRWKRLNLVTLALLATAIVGATALIAVQANRSSAALRAAEEARRVEQEAREDAERQKGEAEQARENIQRLMYMRNVEQAAREWEAARPQR